MSEPQVRLTNYWQVAAGAEQRDYSRRFLQYGFAFVGGDKQIQTMKKVKSGDVIVLKQGKLKILAAGRVVERNGEAVGVGDKEWMRDFDGWDLPAYCHVNWHMPSEPIDAQGLGMRAIEHLNNRDAQQVAERILQEEPQYPSQPEPPPVRPIEDQEILNLLVREGLRTSTAEELTSTFNRIRLLANYYYQGIYQYGELDAADLGEHETRSHLVLPLLLALGWPEQQVKIELGVRGGKIDIACFARAYRRDTSGELNNEDCTLIIETKDFRYGLDEAPDQVKTYADHFPSCRAVLVSNGYCYKAYKRDLATGQFQQGPSAYLNLLKPHDGYPLDPDNVKGALEVLRLMLPQSWR